MACGLALMCLAGCGAGAARQPDTALRSYAEAVRAGDAPTAYGWLSQDAKKRMSFTVFERTLRERPEDLASLTEALLRPGERTAITATVSGAGGEQLGLVYEDGAWKADLSAVDLYSQATPVTTIASFVRAFDAHRYDVLLRFAPRAHKESLTDKVLRTAWEGEQKPEMLQLVAALRAQLPTAQAEVVGERATVAYGQAGTVQLVLEDGAWKIEEF
jgi:cell division inhibitor SulA